MGTNYCQAEAGRRASLQLDRLKICKHRAALIKGLDVLTDESNAAAEAGHRDLALRLSLDATSVRRKVRDLTKQLDDVQAELDETAPIELEAA